ncbi:unnamed protein product [Diplocarpon coronariae]
MLEMFLWEYQSRDAPPRLVFSVDNISSPNHSLPPNTFFLSESPSLRPEYTIHLHTTLEQQTSPSSLLPSLLLASKRKSPLPPRTISLYCRLRSRPTTLSPLQPSSPPKTTLPSPVVTTPLPILKPSPQPSPAEGKPLHPINSLPPSPSQPSTFSNPSTKARQPRKYPLWNYPPSPNIYTFK